MAVILKGSDYLPAVVLSESTDQDTILDYGAGELAPYTSFLLAAGRKCVAFDPEFCVVGIHDLDAHTRAYDIVMANHVIHTLKRTELQCLFVELSSLCKRPAGRLYINCPIARTALSSQYAPIEHIRLLLSRYFECVWTMERNILLCERPK